MRPANGLVYVLKLNLAVSRMFPVHAAGIGGWAPTDVPSLIPGSADPEVPTGRARAPKAGCPAAHPGAWPV